MYSAIEEVALDAIGYWFGGLALSNVIDGINFVTGSARSVSATLSESKYATTAGSGESAAYVFNGYTTAVRDRIEKMTFAITEVVSTLAETLQPARYQQSSFHNLTDIWICGGFTNTYTNDVKDFTISTETDTANTTNLSVSRTATGSFNSSTIGYTICGRTPTVLNTSEKMPFSTKTFASVSNNFATAVYDVAGASFEDDFAVKLGGYTGSANSAVIEKFTFSTETVSSVTATLSVARSGLGANNSLTKAYIAGYSDNRIDSFTKATEARATETATISAVRNALSATQSGGIR
jgi:hypothetical protein